jgi:tetratricopeptide (TPR) repeat protein
LLNPEAPFVDANAGIEASKAYRKALELAEKKGDVKNAIKGLVNTEGLLNNMGIELYKLGEYTDSYNNFRAELETSALLKEKDEKSRLDDPALYNEKVYFAGLTAYYAEDYQGSIDNLIKAKETGTDESSLYQVIYESYKAMDKADDGLKYLEAGRAAFPEDNGLLFSEINHYLAKGELNKMIGKLEIAHEAEPDNLSVVLTLGQVYDQLQVKANEAGNPDEAEEDFNKALKYYNKALVSVPEDFDLNYSIGALYYNKAAGFTPALNEVANDFSKEGEKKYEALKAKMASLFDQALPYFLKADSIDGSSKNTLIALKEIYARKDEFAKSNEYKERLENLVEN